MFFLHCPVTHAHALTCMLIHAHGVGVKNNNAITATSQWTTGFPLFHLSLVLFIVFPFPWSSLPSPSHTSYRFSFLALPPRSSEEEDHGQLVLEVCTLRGPAVVPVPRAGAAQWICVVGCFVLLGALHPALK